MARRAHRDKDVDREDELLTNASITEAGDPIGSQTERSVDSACQGHLLLHPLGSHGPLYDLNLSPHISPSVPSPCVCTQEHRRPCLHTATATNEKSSLRQTGQERSGTSTGRRATDAVMYRQNLSSIPKTKCAVVRQRIEPARGILPAPD